MKYKYKEQKKSFITYFLGRVAQKNTLSIDKFWNNNVKLAIREIFKLTKFEIN